MKRSLLFFAAFVLALAGTCIAQSEPQSLAELAKQKKPAKKAVLVLSDEDLPPSASAVSDDGAKSNGPSGSSTPADAKAASGQDKSQKQDKKDGGAAVGKDQQVNELKSKLASYQKDEDSFKLSIKRYEDLLANETSDFRRQMYQDAMANDKRNATLYQQKIDEVQGQIAKAQQEQSQPSAKQPESQPAAPGHP